MLQTVERLQQAIPPQHDPDLDFADFVAVGVLWHLICAKVQRVAEGPAASRVAELRWMAETVAGQWLTESSITGDE
jgi:hypothetical protein